MKGQNLLSGSKSPFPPGYTLRVGLLEWNKKGTSIPLAVQVDAYSHTSTSTNRGSGANDVLYYTGGSVQLIHSSTSMAGNAHTTNVTAAIFWLPSYIGLTADGNINFDALKTASGCNRGSRILAWLEKSGGGVAPLKSFLKSLFVKKGGQGND
ncbi:MAG: hypothetical protein RR565_09635 [Erysipelothrix sp.]